MERYIEHLIQDLRAAHRPENRLRPSDFEETITMVQLTGIDPVVFPPSEKLSESQLQNLVEEMILLIESYNYIINLPERLPASIAYPKLLSRWTADIPYVNEGLSALGWI